MSMSFIAYWHYLLMYTFNYASANYLYGQNSVKHTFYQKKNYIKRTYKNICIYILKFVK